MMYEKTGLYGYVYYFLVDYEYTDVAYTLDFYKYLMKKHDIK